MLYGLTDTQYEILKDAVKSGYYEIPKRTDIRKIAKKKGITYGALSMHLRKSEKYVMETLFK